MTASGTVVHRASLRNREKGQGTNNYVKPRYAGIKPEGDKDPRDFVKMGQQGGGHSGEHGPANQESLEGKRGWDPLSRSRYGTFGKKVAAKK